MGELYIYLEIIVLPNHRVPFSPNMIQTSMIVYLFNLQNAFQNVR